MKPKTYSARYTDTHEFIYKNQPSGNLVGQLPLGTREDVPDRESSLCRTDGGDCFEHAFFITPTGRRVLVSVDETEPRRRPHEVRG